MATITTEQIDAAEETLDALREDYPDAATVFDALGFDLDSARSYVTDGRSVEALVGLMTGYIIAKGYSADDVRALIATADPA